MIKASRQREPLLPCNPALLPGGQAGPPSSSWVQSSWALSHSREDSDSDSDVERHQYGARHGVRIGSFLTGNFAPSDKILRECPSKP